MDNSSDFRGKYLHHKGKYYEVLGEARDINWEKYIIYRQNYGRKNWWIRPKDMFFEEISQDGEATLRFKKIGDIESIPEIKNGTFTALHTETGVKYSICHYYGQYNLSLENECGEQLVLDFYQNEKSASKDT